MKILISAIILLAVLAGGFWYIQQSGGDTSGEDLGTYAYMCENGTEFTMTPASDMSYLQLAPIGNAPFPPVAVLTRVGSAGARYEENLPGEGSVVFIGAGEGVQLTVGETTLNCDPKPNPDMAPWNWGDSGEGAGESQD